MPKLFLLVDSTYEIARLLRLGPLLNQRTAHLLVHFGEQLAHIRQGALNVLNI